MPTVEVYYVRESPPCRTVEMVANIAGVTLNKHSVSLFTGEHLKDEYLKLNPLHKVPFLVDGDLKIGESRAIATYLVNKYMPENNTLYPKDPVKRARVDELLNIDVGSFHPALHELFSSQLAAKELDGAKEKAYRNFLEYFENRLKSNGGKKFMVSDDLTVADVALASSFVIAEVCGHKWSEFKLLSEYIERLKSTIPKYKEVNEEPNENLRKYIKSKQGG